MTQGSVQLHASTGVDDATHQLSRPTNLHGSRKYQVCSNCVMDTSDSMITFDEQGVCDHCHGYRTNVLPNWHTDESGKVAFEKIVAKIKADGRNRDFDCIMGMSGGADSSYLLHVAVKEFGLRPLVFHVDGGWNSQIAVNNIEVLINALGLDLYTEVIDWEEMKDFQLATDISATNIAKFRT